MQFALVYGERHTAKPRHAGQCPGCSSTLISKCGEHRAWHWAHRGERHCDSWWEETEWHVTWKNRFPPECREIVREAENGEKHIADVRMPYGRVIEFQHSRLAAEERRKRELFYNSMVWVVDGLARKRDLHNFHKTRRMICRKPLVFSGDETECALLRDWVGRPVDVFFDFGAREEKICAFDGPLLWHLHPSPEGQVILTPVRVALFVAAIYNAFPFPRFRIDRRPAPVFPPPSYPWRRRPESFQQYWRRKRRSRPRF